MERGINTRCLHLEETEGKTENYGAISYPIYQTATYAHPGVGQSTGFDYSRLQNPTKEHLEKLWLLWNMAVMHLHFLPEWQRSLF